MSAIELQCPLCSHTPLADQRPEQGLHLHEVAMHGKPVKVLPIRGDRSTFVPQTTDPVEIKFWEYIDTLREEIRKLR